MAESIKVREKVNPAISLFGEAELPTTQLPQIADVIKYYLRERSNLLTNNQGKKEPNANEISKVVANRVEKLWMKASIPTVSQQQILAKVKDCHTK